MTQANPLFITGIGRAGTTLVAHMLSASSHITVAIDALMPLYQSLRNTMLHPLWKSPIDYEFDSGSPLQDFYYDTRRVLALDRILSRDLNLQLRESTWSELRRQIAERARKDAPDIVDEVATLSAALNYEELFASVLDCLAASRRGDGWKWLGLKDVWTADFYPAIARAFPSAKFIIVVRDPRACIASNQPAKGRGDYGHPLSYARHWRKVVALATEFMNRSELKDRLYVLRFEDIVSEPEREAQSLCRFLQVDLEQQMLNPASFVDLKTGKTWQGNSGYPDVGTRMTFDRGAITRWRDRFGK